MNYLRTYKQHRVFEGNDKKLEYDDTDKNTVKVAADSLNTLSDQIKEFKSKKANLEKLIMDNRGENAKDISKNIEHILMGVNRDGRNKFLAMYVTIVEKMKKVADLEDKIKYYDQLKQERSGDLSASKSLSDVSDREEQIEKLNDQIKDIDTKSKDMEKEIQELQKEIAQGKKDLDKNVKDSLDEFEKNIKDTEWDIKDPVVK